MCEKQKCLTSLHRKNDFLHGMCGESRLTKMC